MHRARSFEDPLEAALRPLGGVISGAGTQHRKGLLLGFDLSIEVPRRTGERDAAEEVIIAVLSDAGASVGSMLRQPRQRAVRFGSWCWTTIVLPAVGGRDRLDDEGIPRNDRVDALMAELDHSLDGRGAVRSWSVFDTDAVLYLAGADRVELSIALESARDVLPADAFELERDGNA